jgi:hypothetical protein
MCYSNGYADVNGLLLLCDYCSNRIVASGCLFVATVDYGLLVQMCIVVVTVFIHSHSLFLNYYPGYLFELCFIIILIIY